MSWTLLLSILLMPSPSANGDAYPTCGGCFCIPSLNGTAPCPVIWQPQVEFSNATLLAYQQQIPTSIYTLKCNPYEDEACSTSPPQIYLDKPSAVCGFVYTAVGAEGADGRGPSCPSVYSMETFSSRADAERVGAVLTHEGSCGLCSTAQDLSIYLAQDFTDAGKKCATKGVLNEEAGLQCYMDLGLTLECSKIWNLDGIYDSKVCTTTCLGELQDPNNGPSPACQLNDCLQCDEDKAGPIFSAFGARTRRRSGLLSEIIRPCQSIARISVYDPCAHADCCA